MTEFPISASAGSASRAACTLVIAGRRFDLSLWADGDQGAWHWMITAPGVLALAGESTSERKALEDARRAGRTLAQLVAA